MSFPRFAVLLILLTGIGAGAALYFEQAPKLVQSSPPRAPEPALQTVQNSASLPPAKAEPVSAPAPVTPTSAESAPDFYCKPKALAGDGKITAAKKSKIYRWVDENGKVHFSDKAATTQPADVVELKTQEERFALDIHAMDNPLPALFRNQLHARIYKAFDVLAINLDKKHLKKVAVNLHLFYSEANYTAFRTEKVGESAAKSTGFHSGKHNIAAALRRTDAQLINTSLHEAVHVMNLGMFGYLPRWLNEGIAEYLEPMTVVGQGVNVPLQKGWLQHIHKKPLPLTRVLGSTYKDWEGDDRTALYAHSWGLVYFLQSSQQGQRALAELLKQQAKQPCIRIDSAPLLANSYPGGLSALDNDFRLWRQNPPAAHQY